MPKREFQLTCERMYSYGRAMNTRFSMPAIALAGLLVGCATSERQIWPGASPQVRERLGTVGVRVDHSQPRDFAFEEPETKGKSTRDMIGLGISANLGAAVVADGAAPFVLVTMPAFIVGGALYGNVAGISAPKLTRALQAITNATHDCDLAVRFPGEVIGTAQRHGFNLLDASITEGNCDTVLTLRVITQQLVSVGNEGPNPALLLHFLVEARLTDANHQTLYSTYAEARSRRRDFIEWTQDDARRLRNEALRLHRKIARQIVGRVFLGEASE
jgi:hypothetical protein